MQDENFDVDPLSLSVNAAMARQHEIDARAFLRSLAELLESALPGEVTVRRAGLFGGDRRAIRRLEITLPSASDARPHSYAIEDDGAGPLAASRTQTVRNVRLKTESIPMSEWIGEVSRAISERAAENQAIRAALAQMQ
jgi:hypothetical protein